VLRASHGGDGPSTELAEQVSSYLVTKQAQAGELDDMATDALSAEDEVMPFERLAGGRYQLLPLGCVVGTNSTLAGVAVIEIGDSGAGHEGHTQLLNALASTLVQAGDAHGSEGS
jgi:hypothetical protein